MKTFFRYTTLAVAIVSATACMHDGRQNAEIDTAGVPSTSQPVVSPTLGEAIPAPASTQGSQSTRQALDGSLIHNHHAAGAEVATLPMFSVVSMPSTSAESVSRIDRERYAPFDDGGWSLVTERPVSTFSIDVDTGSYANVRRLLNSGRLPPMDAVRVEEMINYFDYDYATAAEGDRPFSVTTEMGPSPWNPHTRLLHIGIRAIDVGTEALPPANLVFLIDVSGSMQSPDKLPLLKSALAMLVQHLDARDQISLVVYAGASGVLLEPTPGNRKSQIRNAIDGLLAGGSTNGGAGIELAYRMAREAYIEGGINRILLATDGDFNVGTVDFEQLVNLIERERKSGVSLTTLGFGGGNYNDHLMQRLANAGNGNHVYIDTLQEARKVLVEERHATLYTIAADVKIQMEFNPATVAEYRLIGYENRLLDREDFNNDKVDAGEIGAGHTVTALYELTLADESERRIDSLRYGAPQDSPTVSGGADELAFLKLRYKTPGISESTLISTVIPVGSMLDELPHTSDRYRFCAAVAGFAQLLRGGENLTAFGYGDVMELARGARGTDTFGYRGEFLSLVALAATLEGQDRQASN